MRVFNVSTNDVAVGVSGQWVSLRAGQNVEVPECTLGSAAYRDTVWTRYTVVIGDGGVQAVMDVPGPGAWFQYGAWVGVGCVAALWTVRLVRAGVREIDWC